jgi:hypothetical protein
MFGLDLRDALASLGWAVVLAFVFLQALYFRGFLIESDLVLLFLGSALVGAIVADVEMLVLIFIGAMALATFIVYFCLYLPVVLGLVIAGGALEEGVIVMIFRSVFPFAIVLILFGGFFGTYIGERLNLR